MLRLLPLVLLAAGCVGGAGELRGPDRPMGSQRLIVDVGTGDVLPAGEAADRLARLRHVYVGEEHTNPSFHAVQLEVLKALHARGADVAIGVEWLPASAQPALDAWVAGALDEPAFLARVDWEHVWGHAWESYAPILRWAREEHVPVWGLNAAPGLARKVASLGVDRLTAADRALLPPLDTGNEAHREFFRALMAKVAHAHAPPAPGAPPPHGHGHGVGSSATFERYYQAQLVWDETMSRTLVAHLRGPEGRGRVAVVFAGLGHVDHGLGVPLRARALLGQDFAIVLPVPFGDMPEAADALRAGPYPARRADLLWEAPLVGGEVARGR